MLVSGQTQGSAPTALITLNPPGVGICLIDENVITTPHKLKALIVWRGDATHPFLNPHPPSTRFNQSPSPTRMQVTAKTQKACPFPGFRLKFAYAI